LGFKKNGKGHKITGTAKPILWGIALSEETQEQKRVRRKDATANDHEKNKYASRRKSKTRGKKAPAVRKSILWKGLSRGKRKSQE